MEFVIFAPHTSFLFGFLFIRMHSKNTEALHFLLKKNIKGTHLKLIKNYFMIIIFISYVAHFLKTGKPAQITYKK